MAKSKSFCCFCGEPRPRDWREHGWLKIEINNSRNIHNRCPKCESSDPYHFIRHAVEYEDGKVCCKRKEGGELCERRKS